jgi:hypothetical protein
LVGFGVRVGLGVGEGSGVIDGSADGVTTGDGVAKELEGVGDPSGVALWSTAL